MTEFPWKICVASSGLGHVSRGIEAWAADLAPALVERGVSTILCKGAGEPESDYERVVSCSTRESTGTKRIRGSVPRFLAWRLGLGSDYAVEQTTFTRNLLKVLRHEKIDILHVQDPQVAILVQRAKRLGFVRTRTILAHGTEEPLEFQRRITYLQHLAPWHLEEAREAGVWKPTWRAIPNFIDTSVFRGVAASENGRDDDSIRDDGGLRRELGIPPDAVVVLSAAALKRQHKRVDYVLSEFAALRDARPDMPVYLVLAGGWAPDTDALVAEGTKRLGDRVRFLIRFPRTRMAELYRAADIFLLGSLKEMMPIALLEATASELPCIVNTHPVMQWMIGPGGISTDMSRAGALQSALRQLTVERQTRCRLGQLARQHCVENFSRQRVIDQILEYYDLVTDRKTAKERR